MISVELAKALRAAGLRWNPATGDRFVIDRPGVDDDVYTVSEMTVERHDHPSGTILGFNGTTEWALDSVTAEESLWLPREDQLRTLLGPAFRQLARRARNGGDGGGDRSAYVVTAVIDGAEQNFTDEDPAIAYGRALEAYIRAALD